MSATISRYLNDYDNVFEKPGKMKLKFRDNRETSKKFKKARKDKPQHKKWSSFTEE